jgi:hypothetical protein
MVAVPKPVTTLGVMAPQVKPDGRMSVSVTAPVNPFDTLIVIVDVADDPELTAGG